MRLSPDHPALIDMQDVPTWKRDLIEAGRKLIEQREANQIKRKADLADARWVETQPPDIQSTSIGK